MSYHHTDNFPRSVTGKVFGRDAYSTADEEQDSFRAPVEPA
jgi:hypothetical protein